MMEEVDSCQDSCQVSFQDEEEVLKRDELLSLDENLVQDACEEEPHEVVLHA